MKRKYFVQRAELNFNGTPLCPEEFQWEDVWGGYVYDTADEAYVDKCNYSKDDDEAVYRVKSRPAFIVNIVNWFKNIF